MEHADRNSLLPLPARIRNKMLNSHFSRGGSLRRLRMPLNVKGLDYEHGAAKLRSEEALVAAFNWLHPQDFVPAAAAQTDAAATPAGFKAM